MNCSKPTDLEDGLTLIVIGITVSFFVCCLLPAIYNTILIVQGEDGDVITPLMNYLNIASDTMLVVNASTDFFFYCLMGRRFRSVFMHLFCAKKYLKQSRNNYSNSEHHHLSRYVETTVNYV